MNFDFTMSYERESLRISETQTSKGGCFLLGFQKSNENKGKPKNTTFYDKEKRAIFQWEPGI